MPKSAPPELDPVATSHLDAVLEHVSTAACVLDAAGGVAFVNAAMRRRLSLGPSELPTGAQLEQLRDAGAEVVTLRDAGGDVTGSVLLHRQEAPQRRLEAVLRSFFENSPVPLQLKDREGRYLSVSRAFESLFGVRRGDIRGRLPGEIFPGGLGETSQRQDRRVMEGGRALAEEIVTTRPDGTPLVFQSVKFPVLGSRVSGLGGVAMDITSLKEAEAELESHRDRLQELVEAQTAQLLGANERLELAAAELRELLDTSPVPVSIVALDDERPLYVNGALVELLGAGSAEILLATPVTRTWSDLAQMAATFRRLDEEGRLVNQDVRRRRLDGSELWVLMTAGFVSFEGRRARMSWLIDISDRKRWEAELVVARDQAEARAQDLRNAQQELVRKERLAALGQVIATVSHELRNPLGTVHASVYSLRKRLAEGQDVEAQIARAERGIERCVTIIGHLLDFSRTRDLTLRPVAVDDWLAGVFEDMPGLEDVEIDLDLGAEGIVLMEPDWLQHAVSNVVSNAVQAMGSGTPAHLCVRTSLTARGVEIAIVDNGPGIAPEVLSRIFEPLFSTKSFGTGLGLPLVQQIMQQHHGGVEARHGEPTGTTFTLWLPRHRDGAAAGD